MALTRPQLLAAARSSRAAIVMPRAFTRLQHRTAHLAANNNSNAKTGSTSAFLSKKHGKTKARPLYQQIELGAAHDTIPNFCDLARKTMTNVANLDAVVEQYPGLVNDGLIERNVTNLLAKMLHTAFREGNPHDKRSTSTSAILGFADQLVEDMTTDKIWSSAIANLHLISLCKEAKDYSRGKRYWKMLVDKEGAIDAGVYGAYIELLAEEGLTPLAEMESLYQEALARFPGTFAAYHFSHNAILPNREDMAHLKGTSAHLLQGIVTARLLHGDWKNAYLGLDTAFRIWPTQMPNRFLTLVRDLRPRAESYRVFMMACRAGLPGLAPRDAVLQTTLMRNLMMKAPLAERPELLLKSVDVNYAFFGYGGSPSNHFCASLMKLMESLVPSPYHRTPEGQQIADLVAQTSREIYHELTNAGIKPRLISLASRIHLIGKTMCLKELGLAMKDMKQLRSFEIGDTGSLERNVLLAAGKIKHKDLIVEAWRDLKAAVRTLNYNDYACLAVACRDAKYKEFFWEEFQRGDPALPGDMYASLMAQLKWEFDQSKAGIHTILPLETVTATMEALKSKISAITELIRSNKVLNFNNSPIEIDFDRVHVGTEEAMRIVYDKLTTDPLAPLLQEKDAEHQQRPKSGTGIPLGELRFRNWVSMTELLKHAEIYEEFKDFVKEKDKTWIRPPQQTLNPVISDPDQLLEEVKRLRNIQEVPKLPDISSDYEARQVKI